MMMMISNSDDPTTRTGAYIRAWGVGSSPKRHRNHDEGIPCLIQCGKIIVMYNRGPSLNNVN